MKTTLLFRQNLLYVHGTIVFNIFIILFLKRTGVKSAFLKFDGKCELNNELLKCYKKVCDVNGSFIILTGISLPG